MSKQFFDVFPTLHVNNELHALFEGVKVTKVATNQDRNYLHIHINSNYLIAKKYVYDVEFAIWEQLLGSGETDVLIVESFELSKQYTPENLMNEYKESILTELRHRSIVEYNMFANAKIYFEGENTLCLEFEDSIVAEGKSERMLTLIREIYEERCHIPIEIRVSYRKAKKSKMEEHNAIRLQQEVSAIIERNAELQSEAKPEKAEEQKPKKAEKAAKAVAFMKRQEGYRPMRQSDDPNLIYGRDFDDEPIELIRVIGEMGEIVFRGQVTSCDTREIRNEKSIVMFAVTDFTDTIMVKMFVRNEQLTEILGEIKKGAFLKIKGVTTIDRFDSELTIGSVTGIKKISDFRVFRKDTSPEKRVELHCHTKMSDMDGITDVAEIVKRAHAWGHPAVAITDHGVVQAFPEANHVIEALDKDDPFKVIYGVEAYLVDDMQDIVANAKAQTLDDTYVILGMKTTGVSARQDAIVEVAAMKIQGEKVLEEYSTFVNPKVPIPFQVAANIGVTDAMVIDAPTLETVLPQLLEFIGSNPIVGYREGVELEFLDQACKKQGMEQEFTYLNIIALARVLVPTISKYELPAIAKAISVPVIVGKRVMDNVRTCEKIFGKFKDLLAEREIWSLEGINEFGSNNVDAIKKMPSYHAIILAKNEEGRVNLYRLISMSHLTYYARRPRIPKSEFLRYREGLLIGSACEAGELYRALVAQKSEEEIARLVHFYDYLEIQPLGNNKFMIVSEEEEFQHIRSEEDLQDLNRKIVELGEAFNKPVVATCDVHFMEPDDDVYRKIVMAGHGFKDVDDQAPLYFRTTEEMLEEFAYLGSKKAYEVVVTNTVKIADMVEKISPVRPDKCPPIIEDSDKQLREICYNKAHSMYGENLPSIVVERLERELKSIISNGFAVMYIIAQKLVWKSNEDGYLVGSRGSVGSSFVATMAGITEVNPLSPHYYCTNCHYSDFESPEVRKYAGGCGWDMPDKNCPECGAPLVKDGFDIPFETFLGFKGNKEPDIDLNFSGDYQSNAHKYTEVIFGEGQTFRAGTIGTLADKTAYGYVKNFYEERGMGKRKCEIERLLQGCVGIRRSTGQHPGGIIVLPIGQDINSFTPVQHPANDVTSDIITTHFDYHSIDHNLLKLDILGHDDPTMIKMLEELVEQLTGEPFVATEVKLDDPGVMKLFADTSSLGITPEDIDGCPVGCLGIPEFGTDFVIQMVVDTQPKTLSDLIRISGLSHGTDVWLNNAQTLIQEGKATISTAICTRDDIMTYLINNGMESERSFKIMEDVRKGKVAKGKSANWNEWKEDMLAHGIPDWYVWSCEQIKYMFPKAHAAAYVMMAYRIAYCKVYYPLAYYAAYFSIRASAFSYELMCQGKEKLEYYIRDYKKRNDTLSQKEQDTLKDMKLVQEMYARGFEFLPIDIYKSKATKFQIVDGKLLPPFSSIEGMGDKAADAVEMAAAEGPFLSRDDFRQRTKVSKTVIDFMADLGLFGDIPETNQLSLFDF